MKRSSRAPALDPWLVATLLAGACFLFVRLGDRALWTDEAETALLARNILRFGLPHAFDGINYVSQWVVAGREDFNQQGIWVLSPWLQLYWAAGSFAAFGANALTARLPFAAVGLGAVWMLHRLALLALRDRRVARLAALLLVFCVPFLLHARQARYYALVAFLAPAAVAAYLRVLERRPRAALWLVLAIALLFHASYAAWVPITAGLAIHAAFFARPRIALGRAAAIGAGVLALVGPWAVYARIDRSASLIDPAHFAFNLLNYAITLNHYVLPLAWIAVVWALARLARNGPAPAPGRVLPQPLLGVVLCLVATSLLFASINSNYFFRYVIQLVPLLVLVHAALLIRVADLLRERFGAAAGRIALAVLVPLATLTTLPALPVFPLLRALEARAPREPWADDPLLRRPRAEYATPLSEIFELGYELTHEVRGPDSAIAQFLDAHADPDDLVFADYGDLPIAFATPLTVRGGSEGVPYLGEPDWIVSRGFEPSQALARFAREHDYTAHPLDVADTRWESQPDPYAHRYRTVPLAGSGYPPIVVYEHPDRRSSPEALALGVPRGPLPAPRRAGPPNILLVSMDGVRADRVLAAATTFAGPTRMADLAATGTLFTQCRSTATGTAPAAASLLTGRTPRELGRPGARNACAPGVPTLADRLRAAGYETAAVVPNLSLPAELGLAGGFDRWLAPPPGVARRADFAVAREARHWLLSRDGARPWFLWVHLGAAHGPYRAATNPFGSLAPLSARVRATTALDPTPLALLPGNGTGGGVPLYQQLRGATTAGPYRRTHDVLTLVGDFFAGELVDTLRVMGAADTTVTAVVGTHGESLGERDVYFDHGENLDDSVLQVPWIVQVPGAPPARVDEPVSILDVAPTLAALAGAPGPFDASGHDLSAACRGAEANPGDRSGTPAELFPPQGAGEILAVVGRRYRVELAAGGSIRAFELSDPTAAPIDPASRSDAELSALVAQLETLRAQAPAERGAAIALTPERRAGLLSLGYATERLDRE